MNRQANVRTDEWKDKQKNRQNYRLTDIRTNVYDKVAN
jgi:hypothetical protein